MSHADHTFGPYRPGGARPLTPAMLATREAISDRFGEVVELRRAWVAAGRPADMADPYWRSVVSASADQAAVDFGHVAYGWATPLVVLR